MSKLNDRPTRVAGVIGCFLCGVATADTQHKVRLMTLVIQTLYQIQLTL